MNETPWDFIPKKILRNWIIEYSNLQEIVQGGPIIGNLSINKINIEKYLFGGPALEFENHLYVPLFRTKFLHNGFQLCRIDLVTRKIDVLTQSEDLIYLDKIESNRLYYYTDINKQKKKFCIV